MLHRNRRKIRTFCRLCAKRRLFFGEKRAIIAGLRLRGRLSETGVIMYRDLTKGNITKGLLLFALPMIAGNLLQQFYNIADTLIVGQALGKNALAAVGSAYTLMTFLTSIFLGLSMGAGALFSIYLGKKDYGALRSAVHHALVLIFAVTAALNVLVYAFLDPILRFLQIPDELYSSMREYLVIIFAGLIATFLYNFFACLLRAVGNSVAPLWFLGTSALLNIALDLLFALVFVFANPLMRIFVQAGETQVLAAGVLYLRVEGACYVGIGCLFLLYGFYRAIKRPGMSVVLTVISLGTRVVLAYLLAGPIGEIGIWIAIPIGWVLADLTGYGYYFRHKQKLLPQEQK